MTDLALRRIHFAESIYHVKYLHRYRSRPSAQLMTARVCYHGMFQPAANQAINVGIFSNIACKGCRGAFLIFLENFPSQLINAVIVVGLDLQSSKSLFNLWWLMQSKWKVRIFCRVDILETAMWPIYSPPPCLLPGGQERRVQPLSFLWVLFHRQLWTQEPGMLSWFFCWSSYEACLSPPSTLTTGVIFLIPQFSCSPRHVVNYCDHRG